jgi:NAD(P)-dependent dehydrogenase (short-subunit alcohol dehydrogenase family)
VRLEGTVALVTGAGRRIGRALAIGFAEAGADVVVHYGRSADDAAETAGRIRDLGRETLAFRADLRSAEEIDALFSAVEERFGHLDVLVNSAATFERCAWDDITAEAWDEVLAVNLRAPFLCTQRGARSMRLAPSRVSASSDAPAPGAVIQLADLAGVTTWRGYAHHGVSKAGLLHLTRVAARELAPDVRVNAIIPGPILPPPGESPDSEAWRRKGDRVPLGRVGAPSDVVEAALFLARSDYVTGIEIPVDAGERLLPGGRS